MPIDTILLVGLGNPGEKYHATRHNIGFEVIDRLAEQGGAAAFSEKWDALTTKVSLWGAVLHLVKPMTYMNLSGRAVARYLDFFKIPPASMVVVHDDLDMKTGRLKFVLGGGAGGHNGIRSIVGTLGDNGFYRLKIGIGRPGDGQVPAQMPVERYVLTPFGVEEHSLISERIDEVVKGLQTFVESGPEKAMNFLNSFK